MLADRCYFLHGRPERVSSFTLDVSSCCLNSSSYQSPNRFEALRYKNRLLFLLWHNATFHIKPISTTWRFFNLQNIEHASPIGLRCSRTYSYCHLVACDRIQACHTRWFARQWDYFWPWCPQASSDWCWWQHSWPGHCNAWDQDHDCRLHLRYDNQCF